MVLALNMMDSAADRGITIDVDRLSSLLGVPVVPTVARRGEGIDRLKSTIVAELGRSGPRDRFSLPWGERLSPLFDALESRIESAGGLHGGMTPRTAAVKYVEGDAQVAAAVEAAGLRADLDSLVDRLGGRIEAELGYDLQTAVIERRWGFVSGVTAESVRRDLSLKARLSLSDRIDRVVTSRTLGLPIFLLVAWAVFRLTYALGDPLAEILEAAVGYLGDRAGELLAGAGFSGMVSSFVRDGLIGVGPSLSSPHFLAVRLHSAVGGPVHGPGRLRDGQDHAPDGASRQELHPDADGFRLQRPLHHGHPHPPSSAGPHDHLLVLPFASCSARLPVYVLFSGIFFGEHAGDGGVLALRHRHCCGGAVRQASGRDAVQGESRSWSWSCPLPRAVAVHGASPRPRGAMFFQKAGTFILLSVAAVWFLASFPSGVEYASPESFVGHIGRLLAPLLAPAGFGFWQAAVALFFGFLAKEVVVGTLGALLGAGEAGLATSLPQLFTPLTAYAFLVMTLLYAVRGGGAASAGDRQPGFRPVRSPPPRWSATWER